MHSYLGFDLANAHGFTPGSNFKSPAKTITKSPRATVKVLAVNYRRGGAALGNGGIAAKRAN